MSTRDPLTTQDPTYGGRIGRYADFVESINRASDATTRCPASGDD